MSSPPHPQRSQSDSDQASKPNSAKPESGDESPSSETEDGSHTGDELKDDGNVDLRGSVNASVASSNADSGRGSKNKGEGLPPGKLSTLEDLTDAELHFDTDSEDLNDEKEFALHDQSNITPEGRDSDKEEPAPGASDEERISTKEDFIKLSSILHALKTTVEYHDDIAKHNKVRTTIKNSNLNKFFTKDSATEPLFAFVERNYNEWDLEDKIPKSFVNRVPGWL